MTNFATTLLLFSEIFLLATTCTNAQRYVAVGGTSSTCTALEDACGSIQTAVNVAAQGDQILIANGTYVENVRITTPGLTLQPVSPDDVVEIESAGGVPDEMAPEGVPVDVVLDLLAGSIAVENITVRHSGTTATKRDVGIFVRPPATWSRLTRVKVERLRTGEPTTPGSRGLLVFRAHSVVCEDSTFLGNYQDHIHLPTFGAHIEDNMVSGATRLGIVIIQESADSLSINNTIKENVVSGSASDGIQIQGDNNTIVDNTVENSGGYGIHLCGAIASNPPCVAPGTTANASFNQLTGNFLWNNDLGLGTPEDNGSDNSIGGSHEFTNVAGTEESINDVEPGGMHEDDKNATMMDGHDEEEGDGHDGHSHDHDHDNAEEDEAPDEAASKSADAATSGATPTLSSLFHSASVAIVALIAALR